MVAALALLQLGLDVVLLARLEVDTLGALGRVLVPLLRIAPPRDAGDELAARGARVAAEVQPGLVVAGDPESVVAGLRRGEHPANTGAIVVGDVAWQVQALDGDAAVRVIRETGILDQIIDTTTGDVAPVLHGERGVGAAGRVARCVRRAGAVATAGVGRRVTAIQRLQCARADHAPVEVRTGPGHGQMIAALAFLDAGLDVIALAGVQVDGLGALGGVLVPLLGLGPPRDAGDQAAAGLGIVGAEQQMRLVVAGHPERVVAAGGGHQQGAHAGAVVVGDVARQVQSVQLTGLVRLVRESRVLFEGGDVTTAVDPVPVLGLHGGGRGGPGQGAAEQQGGEGDA
ncbi:hypothetical protein KBTX_00493 [wastewater metagenome]|uniref:Uncharacterized protein n=2 Tax=unclassified sequences TaxID=12908 RepID=A0A5B8R5Q3_9ZZZZ|nr:hypothetical protein KBTEX_00493 [uncultured organism]